MNPSTVDPALAETDLAGFVLAVAELREARAKAATPGPYYVVPNDLIGGRMIRNVPKPPSTNEGRDVGDFIGDADCEHIAAEANPAHALAEVAQWRGVVERHRLGWHDPAVTLTGPTVVLQQAKCANRCGDWPCLDLLAVVAAARAYLVGAA